MKILNMINNNLAKLSLFLITLITPITNLADDSAKITIDVVSKDEFVLFLLKNYENRYFQCSEIRVQAKVEDQDGRVARRSIIAFNVELPANSLEIRLEAGKEVIAALRNEMNQPRIVDVGIPNYSCEPKTVTIDNQPKIPFIAADKKVQPQTPFVTADKKVQPQTASVTANKKVFRDRLKDGSLGPEMVWIPAGRFRMGDIHGGGGGNEQSVHWVSVEKFAMGRYEVTFAEYDKFAKATGREKPDDEGWGRGNRPVINVYWYDAIAYTEWLSQQTGQQYRLPTEAEWEYVARADTETKYWWGNTASHEYANYGKDRGFGGSGLAKGKDRWEYTSPVGSFEPNPFGLYDTIGNVWEWTCSEYEDNYKGKEKLCLSKINFDFFNVDSLLMSLLVVRGGSWGFAPYYVRAAVRNYYNLADWSNDIGFRVVRTK